LLSAVSLVLGLWAGPYALFLAVPTLLLAIRYWRVPGQETTTPLPRVVPAIVHGIGMLGVFLIVPGVQYVRDSARRLDSV
jgi:ABC-type spermidine/putrescine transport system permease subunit II